MKEKRLLDLIGDIDDKFIEEAAPKENEKRNVWLRYAGIAASVIFVLFISADLLKKQLDHTVGKDYTLTGTAEESADEEMPLMNDAQSASGGSNSDMGVQNSVSAEKRERTYKREAEASADMAEEAYGEAEPYIFEYTEGGVLIISYEDIPQNVIAGFKKFVTENNMDISGSEYEITISEKDKEYLITQKDGENVYISDEQGNITQK